MRSFLEKYEESCDVRRGSVQVVTDAIGCGCGPQGSPLPCSCHDRSCAAPQSRGRCARQRPTGIGRGESGQDVALFVLELVDRNHDDVHQPPDSEHAAGQQPDDAGPDLADIEPVDTQAAKKNAEEQCRYLALLRYSSGRATGATFSSAIRASSWAEVGPRQNANYSLSG